MGHLQRIRVHLAIAGFFIALFSLVQNADRPLQYVNHHRTYYKQNKDKFLPSLEKFFAEQASAWTRPYRFGEDAALDLLEFKGRGATLNPSIVFLGIDAATLSLDALDEQTITASPALSLLRSQWPIPRQTYALICDRLISAGAKVIAFDLFFPSPSPNPESDAAWKAAIDRYGDHLVIGMNFSEGGSTQGDSQVLTLPSTTLFPTPNKTDPRLGYLNYWQEQDGVIRQVIYRNNEEHANELQGAENFPSYLSFSAQAVQKAGHGEKIPNDLRSRYFRYLDPKDLASVTFPLYSIFDPHNWNQTFAEGTYFKDKIVVIGPQGDWAKDEFSTPVGKINGVEVHCNTINALLQQEFLHPVSNWTILILIASAGMLAWLLALGVPHMGLRFGAVLLLQTFYFLLAQQLFNRPGLILPILGPLLTLNGTALTGLVYDYLVQQFEKSRIRATFEKYVSRNVVREILDHANDYENSLGGTRKPVTVLFSDIRGFTAMSESADSHALVTQLNEYLTAMVECVFKEEGTLDKFIGDAVMAVWGNTVSHGVKADAIQALRCSLAMVQALKKLNARWKAEGRREWQIGIGLNHGTVIVGNMGSPQRKEFSVIGDAVNLGSRFEGQTKQCHVEILLGESVAELVRDTFYLQTLDLVQVPGRQAPVQTYTVLGEKTQPLTSAQARFLELYEEGIKQFRARNFTAARDLFIQTQQIQPEHFMTGEYLREATKYVEQPPGTDWTGVRISQSK